MTSREDDQHDDDFEDSVEDWELLGLDPDTPQDEIDQMWDNQM